ncbi:auxin-binding protein [Gammaproteobacteria bacterium LSUCC0112]|nr:auxin-binding protein [Gammaproteobacteria bacterium LSUCC0112]
MTSKLQMLLIILLTSTINPVSAQPPQTRSDPAGLHIVLHSQVSPIPLNQMHSWTIEIQPDLPIASNSLWESAVIRVSGGMPAHNHGLATSPQVTDYLGDGRFLLEGVRFHMAGVWILQLQIQLDNRHYTAQVELTI